METHHERVFTLFFDDFHHDQNALYMKTFKQIVKQLWKEDKYRSFTAGLSATFLRDGVWGMLYFPLFSKFKSRYSKY
jgi:hypothetical protein